MSRARSSSEQLPLERETGALGKRVFDAAIVLTTGRVLTRGFGLLNLVVLARLLSPEDYGVVALAFTVIGLLTAFVDVGGSSWLVVRDDITTRHLDTAFTMQLLRGIALGAVLFVASWPIAALAGSPALQPVLSVLALSPLIVAFSNTGIEVYGRNLDFSKEVARDVTAAFLASMTAIGIALWLQNYWALVAGTLAANVMGTIATYWRVPYRPRLSLEHWRDFLGFGGWVAGERIFSQLNTVAPQIVIWFWLSAATLGQYTIASNIQKIPLSETLGPIRRSMLPSLASRADDREALKRLFRKVQSVISGFALPIGVGLALLAEEIILVMAGDQWLSAVIVLQILSPALALKMAAGPVNKLAMVTDRLRSSLTRTIIIALVTYPVLIAGAATYGLAGAAAALAALALLRIVLNAVLVKQIIGEPLLGIAINSRRSIVAALAMAGGLALLPQFDTGGELLGTLIVLVVKAALGATIYLATHFLLWLAERRPDGFEKVVLEYGRMALQKTHDFWRSRERSQIREQ